MDTPKQTELSFIHRFIPGKDTSRAPLLLLHGSGGDEHDLLPLAERIGPGRAIVSPRGKTNEQGITRFFRRAADNSRPRCRSDRTTVSTWPANICPRR